MDDVDTAQLKLEGRCIHCKEKLPEHLENCVNHPRLAVLNGIKNSSYYLKTKLVKIAERAKETELLMKQLAEALAKNKNNV
jgi:hypothetical protein